MLQLRPGEANIKKNVVYNQFMYFDEFGHRYIPWYHHHNQSNKHIFTC